MNLTDWQAIQNASGLKAPNLSLVVPKQTLVESHVFRPEILTEDSEDGQKRLYLKGICLQAGVRNHNGRIYPAHEIQRAVKQLNDAMKDGETIWGELDHPEELQIHSDRISHKLVEIMMDGQNAVGKLEILDTDMGIQVQKLLKRGTMGVSSRGTGNVDNSGYVSNFDIVTIDIVARPSAPQAYPQAVYENRNFGLNQQSELTRLCEEWLRSIS